MVQSLFCCLSLCSDFINFHHEIDKLKSILYKNSYPRDLVHTKNCVSAVPKKDLVIALPHFSKSFLQICTRINRIMQNKLQYCTIRLVFQTKCKISNFFTFKGKILLYLCSGSDYNCLQFVLQISVLWLQCYVLWQN